jgi:uncharacterized membrane protein YgcG
MGEIHAPLHEIESVGAGIEGVAPTLTTLARAATGVTGTVSEPPATAAALDQMASRWAGSATRMQDEIAALGVAAGATAVAYRHADEASMNAGSGGGAPDGGGTGSGGGFGGGGSGGGGGGGGSW